MSKNESSEFRGLFERTRRGIQNGETFVPLMFLPFVLFPFILFFVIDASIDVRVWGDTDFWIQAGVIAFIAVYLFLTCIYKRHVTMGDKGYREWVTFGPFTLWSETYNYSEIQSFFIKRRRRRHGRYSRANVVTLRLMNGKELASFWFFDNLQAIGYTRRVNGIVKSRGLPQQQTLKVSSDKPRSWSA